MLAVNRNVVFESGWLKWLVLSLASMFLLLLLLTKSAAGERTDPVLVVDDWQTLIPVVEREILAPSHPAPTDRRQVVPTASRLWAVLESHDAMRFERAIVGWRELSVPDASRDWPLLGMGVAHLQAGNFDRAATLLTSALEVAPKNPVVHYYLGVLYFMDVDETDYEPSSDDPCQLADPLSCRHERARRAFEAAVEFASGLDVHRPLMMPISAFVSYEQDKTIHPNAMLPKRMPRVLDLLRALHVEDFEGRSHLALATIHREEGALREAETHLDHSRRLGMNVADEYRELGDVYASEEMRYDATRAYLKAVKDAKNVSGSLARLMRHVLNPR